MVRFALFALASLLSVQCAQAVTLAKTEHVPRVQLEVGQSLVINGIRAAKCGAEAPSFSEIAADLPKLGIGTLSDGGVGWKFSTSCNEWVAVRAVSFNAAATGRDSVVIDGERTEVTVK